MERSLAEPDLGIVAPVDGPTVVANAERLGPLIDADADEINHQRTLTPRVLDALRAAGVLRMAFPRRLGGPELRIEEQVAAISAISRHDASIAWSAAILSDSGFYASRLGDEAAAEIYPSLDMGTATAFNPLGVAEVVDGGFVVTGSWRFGTAIRCADVIVAGCTVQRNGAPVLAPDGKPAVIGAFLPREAVEITPAGITVGLTGTGSDDYAVNGVFVAERHSFDRLRPPTVDADPLARHVELPFFTGNGVALGLARHALDLAMGHLDRGPGGPKGAGPLTQLGVAEATACYEAAAAYAMETARMISDTVFGGGLLTRAQQARRMTTNVLVAELCQRTVNASSDIVGAQTIMVGHPFERILRDMLTLAKHGMRQRKRLVDAGEMLLVPDSDDPIRVF